MEPKKEAAKPAAPVPKPDSKPAQPAAPGTLLQDQPKPARVEVNRELAALGAKAAGVDKLAGAGTGTGTGPAKAAPGAGAAPLPEGAQPLPALPGTVTEVKLIIGMARPAVEMLVPYLRGADQAAWDALVEPTAALCDHYGVNLGGWMQSPWARLAGAAVPLAMHGFIAWQKDQAGKGKARPAELPGAAPVVPPVPEGQGAAKQAEPVTPGAGGVDIKL